MLSDGGSTPPTSTKRNNATSGWRCCLCVPFADTAALPVPWSAMPRSPSLLQRVPPRARRTLRSLLLAWAGWLVLSTVLLNQPLMDGWINRKPTRAHVGWDFAVSVVPGHVMAWGVDLRGHSRRQGWAIHARRASVWFVPWALASKEIRLAHLRAHDLAVHVKPGRVLLPGPTPKAKPWTIAMPDLRAHDLHSVVIDGVMAATGRASARLDLRKVLSGGEFGVAAGELDWKQLDVVAGTLHPVVGGTLAGQFEITPFVASKTTLRQKFESLHTDLALDLQVPSLALDDQGLRAGDASRRGRLSGRLRLAAGEVGDQTMITLAQPLHVDSDGLAQDREFKASVAVQGQRVSVNASLPAGVQRSTVVAVRLSLPRRAAEEAGRDLQSGENRQVAVDTLAGASGTVDLRLRFQSLSLLRPWLARWKGLEASGQGWLHAQLKLEDGQLLPESRLVFEDAALRLSALGHRVDARMDGELERLDGPPPMRRLALQSVQLRGPDGELLLSDADAAIEFTKARPDATVLEAPVFTLRMAEAAIPDLRVLNRYFPPGAIAFGDGHALLGVLLRIEPDVAHAQGELTLASPAARVHLADRELRGSVDIRARLHDADLAKAELEVQDLHVALGKLSYRQPGGAPVSNGWLRVHVPSARAVVGTPLQFDGHARASMADLRLLMAIYAERSRMPKWLLGLADAGQVDASSRFRFIGGALELDDMAVRNDRYTLDGHLRLAQGDKQGRLLVQWGRLALGIGLAGSETSLHLRGARDWYRAAPAHSAGASPR